MDKNIFMLAIRRFSAVAIVAAGLISCIKDEMPGSRPENGNEGDLRLNIVSQGILDKFEVGTKGTDMKTAQEQEIKSLHIFIFDSQGQYLQASENHRYQGYRNITDGKTVLNIDRNGWAEPEKARNATIVTVANVEDGTFVYDEGTGDKHPSNITGFADFADLVYKPTIPRGITELPSTGMPMFKVESGVDLTSSNTAKSIDIKLKAMMSRIDVSIAVNSQNTDLSGTLPALTITNCEVLNAPLYSTFVENPLASTNVSDSEAPDYVGCHDETWQPDIITIHNNGERLDFTFYVFENLQEKISYTYPPGVEEDDYQRYKPYLADTSKALAFKFSGNYITYNGASYEASYTLYLGANNYDDFKVSRNKQYKNNVTVKGIVNVGNNDEHVTFDARVDITESNPYFISMLRDRTMDSHFNVVPLDVYLFNTSSGVSRSIDVEILDPQTNNWLRLEKVSAAHMLAGSAEDPGTQIETHEAWHAGNGKRKYFTTDLVTNTLKDNTAYYDLGHRDRIYLYVDENLDVWRLNSMDSRTRTATLQLTYKENGVAKEGGIVVEATIISPKYLKGDEKAKFATVKVGDKIVFNPDAACESSVAELSSMLNIDREKAADVKSDFELTVSEIMHLQPAEHDQEFYDGVFGKDAVKNEEEYTAKVREMIAAQLAPESDYRFGIDARKVLEEKAGAVELPVAFLKRWLIATNEKYTAENIDEEFVKMEADLKWHLVKEHIARAFEVKVDDEDLKALALSVTRQQFAQYGMGNLPDEVISNYSQEMLKNKDSRNQLIDRATEAKIQNAIKNAVTLEEKEISAEEFGKLFEA